MENAENLNKKEAHNTIHQNIDIGEDLRRIYENGGEVRKLAAENRSRIFVKGKYFPGLINTRSLGDQIGSTIGVLPVPHIGRYQMNPNKNYHLIVCSDGIYSAVKVDNIVSIFENNDNCNDLF